MITDYEPSDPKWEDFTNFPCPPYIRGNSYRFGSPFERDFPTLIRYERALRHADCERWLEEQVQVARK
jgi:hypothetical protein